MPARQNEGKTPHRPETCGCRLGGGSRVVVVAGAVAVRTDNPWTIPREEDGWQTG
jgi:hypothetical protein